jgi:aspartate-semialdehyde dehydrogenase
MKTYNIAVIGATGLVGSTVLSILEERKFPINNLYLLASHRSAGEMVDFKKKAYFIEDLTKFDFSLTQICFFCVGNDLAEIYVPKAAALGNVVIDKSSYFRYDPEVPLIVPEVNAFAINDFRNKNIIANPNCSTIPITVALKPIYDAVGITRINIATYQSVSGSGKDGISELAEQTGQLLNGNGIKKPRIYSKQIAFNVLPQIDTFEDNGYTREEMKLVWEIKKIFNDQPITVNPTAVRVPVFYGHSAAVHIETKQKLTAKKALELLAKAPGVKLSSGKNAYPTPIPDAAGTDSVFVGRVREDISYPNGLNLWVVTDNVRKGAALNAIQVAEKVIEYI